MAVINTYRLYLKITVVFPIVHNINLLYKIFLKNNPRAIIITYLPNTPALKKVINLHNIKFIWTTEE